MNPLTIFTGPYALLAKWAVIALLCASLFGYGWVKGNEHGTEKLTAYQAEQALASIKVIKGQDKVTERVVTQYVDRVKLVEGVSTTIEKEVTKYVESKPLALACVLDNRWVRLHDAAAVGAVPPAAAGTDAASGEINAAQALPTVTGNYAKAHRNEIRLNGLQQWVREQFKATNGTDLGY